MPGLAPSWPALSPSAFPEGFAILPDPPPQCFEIAFPDPIEEVSFGAECLEQEPTARCEPEYDLAAGFTPVEISLGK